MIDNVLNPFDDNALALNDEQKLYIDANWKDKDLMEITRNVFNNQGLKGSSREGQLVRKYLLEKNYEYKTTQKQKRETIDLTEENKEFIMEYASQMKPYEIARIIFKNETLHPASKEAVIVQNYVKNISPALVKRDDEYTEEDYTPPKTFQRMLKRICEVTLEQLDESKLNVKNKKAIERAIDFVQAPRFVQTMNNMKNVSERIIFESEYIRSVWDKPDLTSDEINLYISLVNEYVIQDRLHRIMAKLNMLLENVTEDPDGRISMTLSESIKGKSEELHQSLTRQQKFVGDLSGRRSDRQKLQTARVKSLISLVEAFKEEEERKNMIRIAEIRKKQVVEEMHKLENMEDWECRIFGITKEEIAE